MKNVNIPKTNTCIQKKNSKLFICVPVHVCMTEPTIVNNRLKTKRKQMIKDEARDKREKRITTLNFI